MKRYLALLFVACMRHAYAIELDCMIEPAQVVELRSPVVGLIQQIHVRRGSSVRQGEVLVTIDSGVERSAADTARFRSQALGALQVAENKLQAAAEKARRNQSLYEEQFLSAQARDDAEAERKLAEAELRAARENLELARLEHAQSEEQVNRRVLRSPFAGMVMNVFLTPGALVDTSESKKPIMKLVQADRLRVEAFAPFVHFNTIKAGMSVMIRPEPPLQGEYAATIKSVDRVIDSASGTFGIVIDLDNRHGKIPAGCRCRMEIKMSR